MAYYNSYLEFGNELESSSDNQDIIDLFNVTPPFLDGFVEEAALLFHGFVLDFQNQFFHAGDF